MVNGLIIQSCEHKELKINANLLKKQMEFWITLDDFIGNYNYLYICRILNKNLMAVTYIEIIIK